MTNLVPMRYNPGTGGYELGHTLQDPHYRTLPQHIRGNPRIMRMIIEEHRRAYHSISIIDMIPEVPEFVSRGLFDAGKLCIVDDAPDIGLFGQRIHHGFVGGILVALGQMLGTVGKLMALTGGGLGDIGGDMTPEEIEKYAGPVEHEEPIYMGRLPANRHPISALPMPKEEVPPDIPGVPV